MSRRFLLCFLTLGLAAVFLDVASDRWGLFVGSLLLGLGATAAVLVTAIIAALSGDRP